MQVNAGAPQKAKAIYPPKPLIPPLGYSMLDEGLYRANGPFSKHNVAFLNQHAFKSVVCLANDTIDKTTQGFIYSRSLQLEHVSVSEAEAIICDVVTCLLDSAVYPVLFIGSSANLADLAVLGYIRRLQGINLVSIFWELELLAMKQNVDLQQFVENVEVEKFDLPARLSKLQLTRANIPSLISRLLPEEDTNQPAGEVSGTGGAEIEVMNGCGEGVISSPASNATRVVESTVSSNEPLSDLESIISGLLFPPTVSGNGGGPTLSDFPLLTPFSSYDPAVSLVDDKDEDD